MSNEETHSDRSAVRIPPEAVARPRRPGPTLDSVTTIRDDGSRRDIHPADVRGRFTAVRRFSAWGLIAVYLLLPWIPVNGAPAVFLDVAARRFHFFGFTLAAQDAWLLFFGVSGLGFALFFLTALFGRLWCGWACPQTVFLEHVFRRIERWIDGDATQRRALAAAPLTAAKAGRRIAKHALFALVALGITHLFLAYFVSLPQLWLYMHEAPAAHWPAFVFVFVAAGILYFNFAWFREQLCIVICPYGRLQSALTDDHSLVIGYDARRGEPRGKLRDMKNWGEGFPRPGLNPAVAAFPGGIGDPALQQIRAGLVQTAAPGCSTKNPAPGREWGSCIDCHRCVQVCPTGIDIRQGLQLECIGCAACVDACDEVMTRVARPRGLIRYDSLVGLGGGRTRWLRPRTVIYGVLLLVGAAVATFAFSTVKPANFLVYRMTGAAYFVDRRDVRNQFLVRLVNKRPAPATFAVRADGLPAGVAAAGFGAPVTIPALDEQVSPLVITANRRAYAGPFAFTVTVQDDAHTYELSRTVEFLGPDPKLLKEDDDNGTAR